VRQRRDGAQYGEFPITEVTNPPEAMVASVVAIAIEAVLDVCGPDQTSIIYVHRGRWAILGRVGS